MGIRAQISLNTSPDYSYCFCCGRNNPIGLKLKFVWDGKAARTEFMPNEQHQDWEGIVIDFANRKNVRGPGRTAVLWDMDGVIVDTAPFHFKAWQQTFAKLGVKYAMAEFKESFGRRNEAIIPEILGKPVSPEEIAAIAREKEALFRRLARGKIKPFPGAVELLQRLSKSKIKMALVSSTPPRNIDSVLESLEIKGVFQTIISGADVSKGKPDPECFLLAASRLGVKPENCVVIEDSTAGVSAAKSAGMKCIAITNTRPRNQLKKADLVIDTLENIDIVDIEKLILPAARL
ncbi:MAG: HAD family phosphatase [Dehalococcoidales bacterium]|nr:HAD family phosphatase [Dehalococcoidales bacterium]